MKKNRRTKHKNNIIETLKSKAPVLENLKNKIDWQQYKNKIVTAYTRKPGVFIGSTFATLLILFLIISPGGNSGDPIPVDETSVTLSLPSDKNDESLAQENQEPNVEGREEDETSFDSPLVESAITHDEDEQSFALSDLTDDSTSSFDDETKESNPSPIVLEINTDNLGSPKQSNTAGVDQTTRSPKKTAVKSWVFKKNPAHYTVQLIGGANKKDILRFIEKNKKLKRLSYFHTIKNGKSWYVVVQSTHKNYSDAEKARKRLPKHLTKFKPWVRPYSSIQKDIVANAEQIILLTNSFASVD